MESINIEKFNNKKVLDGYYKNNFLDGKITKSLKYLNNKEHYQKFIEYFQQKIVKIKNYYGFDMAFWYKTNLSTYSELKKDNVHFNDITSVFLTVFFLNNNYGKLELTKVTFSEIMTSEGIFLRPKIEYIKPFDNFKIENYKLIFWMYDIESIDKRTGEVFLKSQMITIENEDFFFNFIKVLNKNNIKKNNKNTNF